MTINAGGHEDPYAGTGSDTADDAGGAVRPGTPTRGRDEGPADASQAPQAAARLLEATARETEQWRAEARSDADAILAGAREEAAELVRAARQEAESLVTSAREEGAQMKNEARVEAYRVREETTEVRKRHDEDVARLQQLETEHRERLRHHLTEMLDKVDSIPDASDQ
jgi:cell division septum initiation protein DivIVA